MTGIWRILAALLPAAYRYQIVPPVTIVTAAVPLGNPVVGRSFKSKYLPWDVAAETGEYTHIIKSGVEVLSITLARSPT